MPFTLPAVNLPQLVAQAILRLLSWQLEVTVPQSPKFVMVGAPHDSGWDLFFFLLLVYATGIKMSWIGKHTLFRWPVGGLLRRFGGIPVDRRSRHNFVQQVVEVFKGMDGFSVAISPEGTRRKVKYWKTGFYYIALGAGVPIALGFIDYQRKVIGIGPTITPSGDIQADFAPIRSFYSGITRPLPELKPRNPISGS
jgi:1-acyl-sn-glycerol-3-phosphate acyltransferase